MIIYPIFLPTLSFTCVAVLFIPLPAQWRARNIPSISVISWLMLVNFYRGINAILWGTELVVKHVVWCEITTRVSIAAALGLSSSALCLCQHLYYIVAHKYADQTPQQKRRRMYYQLALCLGPGLLAIPIYYVNQGHRFNIIQYMGCEPAIYPTIVYVFTMLIPNVLFALGGIVYGIMALRATYIQQDNWRKLADGYCEEGDMKILPLSYNNSPSTPSTAQPSPISTTSTLIPAPIPPSTHYRMLIICVSEIILDFSVHVYLLAITCSKWPGLRPWIDWADTHWGFNRIDMLPWVVISPESWGNMVAFWCVIPLASLMYVACFVGGGGGSRLAAVGAWISAKILRRRPASELENTSFMPGGEKKRDVMADDWEETMKRNVRSDRSSIGTVLDISPKSRPGTASYCGVPELALAADAGRKKLFHLKIPCPPHVVDYSGVIHPPSPAHTARSQWY